MFRFVSRCVICVFLLPTLAFAQSANDAQRLGPQLQPFLKCFSGSQHSFAVSLDADVVIDGQPQHVDGRLVRFDDQSFDLQLTHPDYSLQIRRRGDATALALPHHKVVFVGAGAVDADDQLSPLGMTDRLLGSGSNITLGVSLLQQADASSIAQVLTGLLDVRFDAAKQHWTAGDDVAFKIDAAENRLLLTLADQHRATLTLEKAVPAARKADDWPDFKQVALPRRELERTLARGVRRGFEIASPSRLLTAPLQRNRKVANGELRWIDGQRVALLKGTPAEIGTAHGTLLAKEARRCIDSVLCTFGTVNTIRTGRWFRHDLDAAYQRLAPHIPVDHKTETIAFAAAAGVEPRTAEVLNVFPELFHCSGFALYGKATKDGKLYHGRVLDYMTTIGLQDSATTFIVAVDGKHAFGNIGYAGFMGSVSGMNDQAISLGEMGGHGEGQWDGVPMATLMRRALEECSTLDEVMELWKESPRTCEYYYVFADGKTNRAVGVAAVPESVEFILPGQTHERLGEGIEDAVVLSAGSRLEALRQRVQQNYGEIDVELGQWLMSRPVAMSSNLHNVLFVPQDGVFYVANASHDEPAANRPYAKIDLTALLDEIREADSPAEFNTTKDAR
ncbi:C45 family autoproteolytic acyltransferase/hydolase [Roseimaritima ulvae]|uniref:Acyl-coenzyme A:6-aminopenicillanic acid acyl-transferase n=1 Tax=Roseimaritima ulvae TaxID=980254 RepID=A0A5B9QXT5_9BACT|nr:C45 family peptidase [Roseimaritima ulvae]QEG42195.1 Acyl-coenzyme A:6-aminopenicillanic acid acyl-transferase [Roseimaritima ulvae]